MDALWVRAVLELPTLAGIGYIFNPSIDQFVKARIISGAVNNNRMRNTDTDKFFQPFLGAFPVDEFPRAAADSADTDDTVIWCSVPAISLRFGRSPADVIDDRDPVFAEPVAERPNTVCIVDF